MVSWAGDTDGRDGEKGEMGDDDDGENNGENKGGIAGKRKRKNDDSNDSGDDTDVQLDSSSDADDDDAKDENIDGGSDDDTDLLTLRSWIREVRWVIRAEGLGQDDKFPQRNVTAASARNPSIVARRCDSENVTAERLASLRGIPGFPLEPYRRGEGGNNNGNEDDAVGLQEDSKPPRPAFQKWLDDLMHYRAKHGGDCNVPLKYAEYPGLGNFVNRQRTEYRKLAQGKASSMTRTKVRQLDGVAFVWSIREGGHASWESRMGELREYGDRYGHTNVPKNYPPNPSLGYWVNEQRFQYRRLIRGKSSYMNHAKMAHLDAVGFKWSLRESKRPWKEWLEELGRYKAMHGHVNVPLKYEHNVPLGSFVNNQRSEYRRYKNGNGAKSSMTEEKVRDLEGLGFLWNVREGRTPWSVRLGELEEYKKRHGTCDVPNNWPENQPLSYWVSKQRQQYKSYVAKTMGGGGVGGGSMACHLTEERVARLDEIGFDWRHHQHHAAPATPVATVGEGDPSNVHPPCDNGGDNIATTAHCAAEAPAVHYHGAIGDATAAPHPPVGV